MAKSEAAGGEAAEMQRASDILAEKLPGLEDPNAPAAADGSKANVGPDGVDLRPLKPLTAAHPDRFSPGEVPSATQMTPGKPVAVTPPAHTSDQSARRVRKPATANEAEKPEARSSQESFIIPGTATDSDHPLVNPEKTAAMRAVPEKNARIITGTVSTAGAGGAPSGLQHQEQHR
jgi:rod shape-determining protein MreC